MADTAQESQAVSESKTGGRPRGAWAGKPWRDALRLAAFGPADEEIKPKTNLDKAALALIKSAGEGDVPALKELGDRLDGKPAQAIVGGEEGDNPVRVINEIQHVIVRPQNQDR